MQFRSCRQVLLGNQASLLRRAWKSTSEQQQLSELREEVAELRGDVRLLVQMLDQDHHIGYRKSRLLDRDPSLLDKGLYKENLELRPSIETARLQPTHVSEMGHLTLAHLALQRNHNAHRERLVREIMSTDNVSWDEANKVLFKMDRVKEKYYWAYTMPYRIGITASFFFAIGSFALVFCHPVAHWYGTQIAGENLPDGKEDVSEMTTNQVGTWTWAWMEPMIGTATFVLLCAQFMKANIVKLNMKSWLELVETSKANMLADKFPQYDRSIVRTWAKPLPKANPNFFPIYERKCGTRGPSSGL